MARNQPKKQYRNYTSKRETPSVKYGDIIIGKFINKLMYDGCKAVAEKHVITAMDNLSSKLSQSPSNIMKECVEKHLAVFEIIRPMKHGGKVYKVPIPMKQSIQEFQSRSQALAFLIQAIRKYKKETSKSLSECIEIIIADTLQGKGYAIQQKKDFQNIVQEGKVFSTLSRNIRRVEGEV